MDNYVVLARKYRPASFETVVGQSTITNSLQNAIRTNHLAHAYLFCGPRGVGKTTCARIFAKTINCAKVLEGFEKSINQEISNAPMIDACNACESCKAFNEGRSFNIHELDAASNNSVDDIRQLIDEVRIPPQIGKYSVYIIDEVHMLSQAAFNALLKTLEEPPSYAIFILATTEKHKVLPTILSRCQVYDFTRITINDTINHLKKVAAWEGLDAEEGALSVIAQKADGGMRDALSIFDQVIAYCGKQITTKQTIEILNVLDEDYYFRLVDMLLKNDYIHALLLLNEVLLKGFDAQHFIEGLGQHIRDLMVSKDEQTVILLEKSDASRQQYAAQAKVCPLMFLLKCIGLINDCDINYRITKNKRLAVELLLLRMSQITASKAPQSTIPQPAPQNAPQSFPKPTPTQVSQPQGRVGVPLTTPTTQPTALGNRDSRPTLGNLPRIGLNSIHPTQVPAQSTTNQPVAEPEQPAHPLRGEEKNKPENKGRTVENIGNLQNNTKSDFTEAELEKAWLTIPSLIQDNAPLKAVLLSVRPKKQEKVVLISLPNVLLEKDLAPVRKTLEAELSKRLQCAITIQTKVVVVKRKYVNSDEERLKNLEEKNPALRYARQKLELVIS